MSVTGRVGVPVVLFGCTAAMAVSLPSLPPVARAVPLAILCPTAGLLLVEIARAWRQAAPSTTRASAPSWRSELVMAGWLVAMGVLVAVGGVFVGIPVYLASYLRVRARTPWSTSLTMALVAWVILFVPLVLVLGLPFDAGWLSPWLPR